ncbi:hypothetical protein [Variovorax sp. PAMC 28711]|uniref:hypothetical protein n=1 Tax=Variovorax sp. PAMC 28711 TaxID=1795631 RepID=UPI00078CB278|nr:hypothetical protein [Variovorax sp. PAMC 28711]AMM24277.1 hypothetical protein AX767_07890 [Variovorax sp. PAMC 28711]
MGTDLLHALLALAVLFLPLLFCWFVLSRTARRHPHGHERDRDRGDPHGDRPPRGDRPMR